jgi:hypothetical protein
MKYDGESSPRLRSGGRMATPKKKTMCGCASAAMTEDSCSNSRSDSASKAWPLERL